MGILMDENGQYLQNAEKRAVRASNRRGLLNSSISASGGVAAAIEAALPIAQQDANVYAERGLSHQKYEQDLDLLTRELDSRADLQKMDLDAAMERLITEYDRKGDMQSKQIAADMSNLRAQLQSNQNIAQLQSETQRGIAQLQANTSLQETGMKIGSQERIAQMDIAASMDRLVAEYGFRMDISAQDNQFAMERLMTEIEGNKELQSMVNDFNATENQLTRDFEQTMQDARFAQEDKNNYATLFNNQYNNYHSKKYAILTDPNLSPLERTQATKMLNNDLQAGLDLAAGAIGLPPNDWE